MTTLTVGDLEFQVRRSKRRRTLGLTVERDGRLILSAPPDVGGDRLERFAKQKRFWVYEKLAAKEALAPGLPARKFVTGEGFPYLGRWYRLQLVGDLDVAVKLERGRFKMRREEAARGRAKMVRWYTEHAQEWLTERVVPLAARVGVSPEDVVVQELGFRWGSCGKGSRLNFHWQTILLPPPIIDYIVVHELVHLRVPHHTPGFWRAIERAIPEWEQRRRWLAERGREFIV